ncbi:aminotransferase class IV [Geminicoccus flavidas]|uniref:aminotransferase class IV n=1 Tax=Geminicoccus flavidas TaxID=2506407 RepID=UPI00135BD47D|nr:aminotransferase class IV [Geminicoccus flavidas]
MDWLWQDGRLRPAQEACIDPADRGLLLGDGLFETMRASGGRVPLLHLHTARLAASAGALGIPLPCDLAGLELAISDLLARTGLADAAVRLTLTRGAGPRGLLPPEPCRPMLLLRAFPSSGSAPAPAQAVTAAIPRNERSPLSRIKSLGCLDQILCLRAALASSANEAILLNTRGDLACATSANLFLVKDGTLVTPDIGSGVLPGITRARLMAALPAQERPLRRDELLAADEAFLTNCLIGVRPLLSLDGQPIGTGQPGPATTRAARLLEAA